jgi:hypothetical protein
MTDREEEGKRRLRERMCEDWGVLLVGGSHGVARNEPPPEPGKQVVLPRAVADLQARSDFGEKKYSTKLMTHNGRDALTDAHQECLDLLLYLTQAIMEREGRMDQRELQEENTRLVLENRRLTKEVEQWKNTEENQDST